MLYFPSRLVNKRIEWFRVIAAHHLKGRKRLEGKRRNMSQQNSSDSVSLSAEVEALRQQIAQLQAMVRRADAGNNTPEALAAPLDLILRHLPLAYAYHSVILENGVPVDYRYLDLNPAFELHTGLKRDQLIGKRVKEVFKNLEPYWIEQFGNVAITGNSICLENHVAELGRTYSVTAFSPKPMHFAVFFQDITHIRRSEQALKAAQENLKTALKAGSAAIWTFMLHQKKVTWFGFEELLGIPDGEFDQAAQEILREHVREEDRPVLFAEFEALATGAKKTLEVEHRLKSPKAGEIWALARGWAEVDAQGTVVRIQGTTVDITRVKRAEAEKRLLESQVLHAQKLESLGVLAGGIAHDFNNLLMSILGNADMALAALSDVSPAREHLEQIQLTSKRAADLTRQMLAYSGKGRFVVEALDLKAVVEEMIHLLQITISKKAVLKCSFAENVPPIEADGTQVRQVIMNLITNASEAVGDKSGIISLSTGVQMCDRQYLDLTPLGAELPEGEYAFVEVSDTGCGMSREVMGRIFEPFFTTKFTGRGLGMAAVLGIVRGHRGTIKVYSEVGKGTSFKVLFPALKRAAKPQPRVENIDQNWKGEGIVLLVDDEEMVLRTGRRMLERLGFQVLTARDGREALQIFRERADDIACTVMDLTMPHLNGEEAFREMRVLRSDARIILSSGYNEQEVVQRFVGKRLCGFLQKPYQLQALQEKLREVLAAKIE